MAMMGRTGCSGCTCCCVCGCDWICACDCWAEAVSAAAEDWSSRTLNQFKGQRRLRLRL